MFYHVSALFMSQKIWVSAVKMSQLNSVPHMTGWWEVTDTDLKIAVTQVRSLIPFRKVWATPTLWILLICWMLETLKYQAWSIPRNFSVYSPAQSWAPKEFSSNRDGIFFSINYLHICLNRIYAESYLNICLNTEGHIQTHLIQESHSSKNLIFLPIIFVGLYVYMGEDKEFYLWIHRIWCQLG